MKYVAAGKRPQDGIAKLVPRRGGGNKNGNRGYRPKGVWLLQLMLLPGET